MTRARPWAADELRRLRELRRAGATLAEAAEALGRPKSTCRGRWLAACGRGRAKRAAFFRRVLALHGAGLSARQVALRLGLHGSTVVNWLKDAGRDTSQSRGQRARQAAGPPPEGQITAMLRSREAGRRRRAAALGWPEAESPHQARVLAALAAAAAPRTGLELAAALGYAARRAESSALRRHLDALVFYGLVEKSRRPGAAGHAREYRLSALLLARRAGDLR